VLVDNGRSELLRSTDFRRTLNCIRCGACFNTCPVYRRSGGHSYGVTVGGPIGSIIYAARDPVANKSLPLACSLCGSCSDVCPVKIDIHEQLFISRRQLANLGLISPAKRIALRFTAAIFRRPWLYRVAGHAARTTLRLMPRAILHSRFNVWGKQRELPASPHQSFRQLYRQRKER
jgi:L-lactate dehydrogenase complex protein LldF